MSEPEFLNPYKFEKACETFQDYGCGCGWCHDCGWPEADHAPNRSAQECTCGLPPTDCCCKNRPAQAPAKERIWPTPVAVFSDGPLPPEPAINTTKLLEISTGLMRPNAEMVFSMARRLLHLEGRVEAAGDGFKEKVSWRIDQLCGVGEQEFMKVIETPDRAHAESWLPSHSFTMRLVKIETRETVVEVRTASKESEQP